MDTLLFHYDDVEDLVIEAAEVLGSGKVGNITITGKIICELGTTMITNMIID